MEHVSLTTVDNFRLAGAIGRQGQALLLNRPFKDGFEALRKALEQAGELRHQDEATGIVTGIIKYGAEKVAVCAKAEPDGGHTRIRIAAQAQSVFTLGGRSAIERLAAGLQHADDPEFQADRKGLTGKAALVQGGILAGVILTLLLLASELAFFSNLLTVLACCGIASFVHFFKEHRRLLAGNLPPPAAEYGDVEVQYFIQAAPGSFKTAPGYWLIAVALIVIFLTSSMLALLPLAVLGLWLWLRRQDWLEIEKNAGRTQVKFAVTGWSAAAADSK